MSPSFDFVLIVAFAAVPVKIAVHELGHAAAALVLTDGPVSVSVGAPSLPAANIRAGRLSIRLCPLGYAGRCRGTWRKSRLQGLAIVLAGTCANLLVAVVLALVAMFASGDAHTVLLTLAAVNASGLVNLIPVRPRAYPVRVPANDGLQALCLIRNRPLPVASPKPRVPLSQRHLKPVEAVAVVAVIACSGTLALASPVLVAGLSGVGLQLAISAWCEQRTVPSPAPGARSAAE